jgi:D-inositol-3-phosphate glycosyltransferase
MEGAGVTYGQGRLVRQRAQPWPNPRRIATLSVHTSPMHQPGTGDAGGMNVYIVEVAKRLADAGVEVEIFTRATASGLPRAVEMSPGVLVRHVTAGPYEGLAKEDLPAQMCAFTTGVLQVGWLAKDRWGVPLVHTAHTLAKVKNDQLAEGDRPEPLSRIIGEEQVVAEADRLVANTDAERDELISRYGADPHRVSVVMPGVDLERFRPAAVGGAVEARLRARRQWGLPGDAYVVAFVGRIQPLKAPDVLVRAAAALHMRDPELARKLVVLIVGGPSGTGLERPAALMELAASLGLSDAVRFLPPQTGPALADLYRAADLVAVPSYNESFGLVALEAQACGTPVVAAAVGGLVTAVRDGVSGVLVDGHDPDDWARVLGGLLGSPGHRALFSREAVKHARNFSWTRTASGLLAIYREAVAEQRSRIASELAGEAAVLGAGGTASLSVGEAATLGAGAW